MATNTKQEATVFQASLKQHLATPPLKKQATPEQRRLLTLVMVAKVSATSQRQRVLTTEFFRIQTMLIMTPIETFRIMNKNSYMVQRLQIINLLLP